jgi:hypothetical protein
MKNKIKRRVDNNKKNTSSLVFLWTIFFILLIACGALYLNKDNLVDLFTKDKVVVDKTGMVNDKYEKMIKVDVDSPNIQHLFSLVHKDFVSVDGVIYKNKKLTVNEMDDFYKFALASNLYSGEAIRNNNAGINEITAYLDEEIVKDKFAKEEYAIAIKKGNSELVAAINSTIEKMKANGEYEALVAAFMPADGAIVVPADLELTGDKVLKLGTNAAFPPFEYVDGAKIVGFDITMGQKIAADAGTKLEVVDMAFDSLIPALASGAIDFIAAGMSVTEERQKNVDFSSPYFESEQVIIIRK